MVCEFGVSQGSVLVLLMFSLYVSPIINVISGFGIALSQYADDTQSYISLKDEGAISLLSDCFESVHWWFTACHWIQKSLKPSSFAPTLDSVVRVSSKWLISAMFIFSLVPGDKWIQYYSLLFNECNSVKEEICSTVVSVTNTEEHRTTVCCCYNNSAAY